MSVALKLSVPDCDCHATAVVAKKRVVCCPWLQDNNPFPPNQVMGKLQVGTRACAQHAILLDYCGACAAAQVIAGIGAMRTFVLLRDLPSVLRSAE